MQCLLENPSYGTVTMKERKNTYFIGSLSFIFLKVFSLSRVKGV